MLRAFAVGMTILILLPTTGCRTTRMLAGVLCDNTIYAVTNPVSTAKEVTWLFSKPLNHPPRCGDDTIEAWILKNADAPVLGEVKLMFGGSEFFPALRNALEEADGFIDLQTYLIDNDDVAAEYLKLLRRKAESIPVRVMCDGFGTWSSGRIEAPSQDPLYEKEFTDVFRELRVNAPPNLEIRRTPNLLLSSHHSKIIVADGEVAFTGGMNLGREYLVDFRDLMIECRGPLVGRLEQEFDNTWQRSIPFGELLEKSQSQELNPPQACESSARNSGTKVWVLRTEPYNREIFNVQMAAIQRARHRIYVENPYLWDRKFVEGLCEASKRGVDVRVTIPYETNAPIGDGGNWAMANRMFDAGVRVFVIPGYSHVKAALYDDWVCVGSANYDYLSLSKNRELDLFLKEECFVNEVENDVFVDAWKNAHELREPVTLYFLDRLSALLSRGF